MIKTAVIMAAGLGSRFGHYTDLVPKGFVEIGGKPMIEHSIETLLSCGIERILIGTGYRKEAYEQLKGKFPMIETCFSPRYAETNSLYTLYNMRDLVGEDDFLLLESDLIFEKKAIGSLMDCPQEDVLLITPLTKFQDQYYVEYDQNHILSACSVNRDEVDVKGEFVGIHKLSNTFYKLMCADYAKIVDAQPKMGYEYELLNMSLNIRPLYVLNVPQLKWYEIDDVQDLQYAQEHVFPYCRL